MVKVVRMYLSCLKNHKWERNSPIRYLRETHDFSNSRQSRPSLIFHRVKKTGLNVIHKAKAVFRKFLRDIRRCLQQVKVILNAFLWAGLQSARIPRLHKSIQSSSTYRLKAPNTMSSISEWSGSLALWTPRMSSSLKWLAPQSTKMVSRLLHPNHCRSNAPVWWITTTEESPRKTSNSITPCKAGATRPAGVRAISIWS